MEGCAEESDGATPTAITAAQRVLDALERVRADFIIRATVMVSLANNIHPFVPLWSRAVPFEDPHANTPTQSSPRLPPEIWDMIIRCLSPYLDATTLLHCVLVSHGWLPASRDVLRQSTCQTLKIKEANVLFASDAPTSPPASSLRLKVLSVAVDSEGESRSSSWNTLLACMAKRVPTLRIFHMSGLAFDSRIQAQHAAACLSAFTHLTTLELSDSKFPSFTLFRRTLAALPRLSSLTTKDVSFPIYPVDTTAILRPSSRPLLQHLKIQGAESDCGHILLHYLASTPSCTSLRTFDFHLFDPPTSSPFALVLRTAALSKLLPFVKNLYFGHPSHADPSFLSSLLSSLRNMEDVSLDFPAATTETLLAIADGIVRANSTHLCRIGLSLPLVALTSASGADIAKLAALTSGAAFECVERAYFYLRTENPESEEDVVMEPEAADALGTHVAEIVASAWPPSSRQADNLPGRRRTLLAAT
ncbi:uncharacterized protein BXZ73DRAFT_106648 [Epithele typhae]|uniref:uncharacterized protein n=1 Tax=Epithele typhae TaxID=378194 RepID=UPI002007AE0A|nr:uncharacterized protein BXZ73DRAFT_106648 [Epithele typhae]KAH9914402.1 hypothetical protein BXZ73DRAFT_106648 [Epithele typhae]